ncbi:MAG: DUF427 domain-containing protein [Gammaproteobacteria bacterium]|nr:DUF427 domain-containing protein [Gammaproteobacteria bacterium]
MMKAEWQGVEIARSENTEVVEGNHYFPAADINAEYFEASGHRSTCHWKGEAHYYHVVINGQRNENAAWYYPEPKAAASQIKGYVAFWKGVKVTAT